MAARTFIHFIKLEQIKTFLRRYRRKVARISHSTYIQSPHRKLITNIHTINGEKKLVLINDKDYLNEAQWTLGFIFDLENDTLQLYSRDGKISTVNRI